MLIDEKFFKGEILIPNLAMQGVGISDSICAANRKRLGDFIEKYERIFLCHLLGRTMAGEFLKGLAAGEEKWIRLKEILVSEPFLSSPIANYVYYWFVRDRTTNTSGVGETVGQANNSAIVSPEQKMARAWNEMVDELTSVIKFISENRQTYPDFMPNYNAHIFFHINTLNL